MTVRLVYPIDQCTTAETLVSRVSVIDHHSDGTQTPVFCVDQDSVSAVDCIPVPQAWFYGKQVLEFWPILFSLELLMSPKRSFVAPVPTTVAQCHNS